MSEEKLYAVKNDKGKYFDCENAKFMPLSKSYCPVLVSEDSAEAMANYYCGHVVTLIEEPEKVVLTKEQAEIVKGANESQFPANYISRNSGEDEEKLLMNAYINGYTVAKEKKYNVKVPHTKDVWYYKSGDGNLRAICPEDKKLRGTFTESEIKHYGLQDCEKEEVTDYDD